MRISFLLFPLVFGCNFVSAQNLSSGQAGFDPKKLKPLYSSRVIAINHDPHICHYYDSIAIYNWNGEVNSDAYTGYKPLGRDFIVNNKLPDLSDGQHRNSR